MPSIIFKIYEIQNTGKGVINEIEPENLLQIYDAEQGLQTFQETLSVGNTIGGTTDINILPGGRFTTQPEDLTLDLGGFIKASNISNNPTPLISSIVAYFGKKLSNTYSGLMVTNLGMFIEDMFHSKGLEYSGDYETNFTNRTLITKQYLLSQLALLPIPDGSETKLVAGTNTTVTGDGTISTPYVVNSTATFTPQGIQDTIDINNLINQAEIEIALNGGLYVYAIPPSTEIYGTLFAQYGGQGANAVTSFIGTESSLGKSTLTFYTDKTHFIDTRFSKGIENGGDYEANFTARSLITKQYLESETNKQKVITYPTDFTGTNYTLTNADKDYTIFINNGTTAVTITLNTGVTSTNYCVGFIQEGTADVTHIGTGVSLTNPTGLKIKGQGEQTFIERKLATSTFYLLGNTKV